MAKAAKYDSVADVPSPSASSSWGRQADGKAATMVILSAVAMIRGADLQILPASFRAMEVDLEITPVALGTLALCQGVAAATSGPMWGNLVDSGLSRTVLLTFGASAWGCCTFLLAFAKHYSSMAVLRILNGVALAMLMPVTQSFIAQLSRPEHRGRYFGHIAFFTAVGQVLACLLVTPLSNMQVWGMQGWRFALAVVGFLSIAITPLVPMMITEESRAWRPERLGFSREVRKFSEFVKIPTFRVIILQGVFGTIPGAAFSFVTMYFQYIGISDLLAALLIALNVIGDACGSLLGGMIGDALALWSPRYGRALTGQVSALMAVPLVATIFLGIPARPEMVAEFGGVMFLLGLFGTSWVGPGCLCPIMCDIVPRSALGSAYAWELSIVYCSGNFIGPILVGGLSENWFGYHLNNVQVEKMSPAVRQQNARALGESLFLSSAVPYIISAVIFLFLFQTYDSDRRRMEDSPEDFASEDSGKESPHEETRLLPEPETEPDRMAAH